MMLLILILTMGKALKFCSSFFSQFFFSNFLFQKKKHLIDCIVLMMMIDGYCEQCNAKVVHLMERHQLQGNFLHFILSINTSIIFFLNKHTFTKKKEHHFVLLQNRKEMQLRTHLQPERWVSFQFE